MREILLTKGYKAIVDDDDFDRINGVNWCALVGINIRAVRRKNYRFIYMHHEVLSVDSRAIKPMEVDHIDGNSLNNQKSNLRLVSHKENMRNQSRVRNATYVGFVKSRKKWRARVNRVKSLGSFGTKEEALKAVEDYYANN